MEEKYKKFLDSVPVIMQGLTVFGTTSPVSAFVASAVAKTIFLWGDLANKKGSDFMQQFIDNEDEIEKEIINSEKFVSVFLDVFDKNIRESNEEKRQLLKNYILNFACGKEKDFNEHTKLIGVLNDITMEEYAILKLWDKDNECCITNNDLSSYTVSEIESRLRHTCRDHFLFNEEYFKNKNKCNQVLLALGNKGLLWVLSKDNFGSGEEARANKEITEFGAKFLTFVK